MFHLDVAYSRSGLAYVAMAIHVYCKCMFQIFQLFRTYVASVLSGVAYIIVAIHVCCKRMLQMFYLLQTYVAANASCFKFFINKRGKRAEAEAVPVGVGGICMRNSRWAGTSVAACVAAIGGHV
jgi:hypothetical protein